MCPSLTFASEQSSDIGGGSAVVHLLDHDPHLQPQQYVATGAPAPAHFSGALQASLHQSRYDSLIDGKVDSPEVRYSGRIEWPLSGDGSDVFGFLLFISIGG